MGLGARAALGVALGIVALGCAGAQLSVEERCLTSEDGTHPELRRSANEESGTTKHGARWYVRDSFNHMSSWVIEIDGPPSQYLSNVDRLMCESRKSGGVFPQDMNAKLDKTLAELKTYSHRVYMQYQYQAPSASEPHTTTKYANLDGETCEIGQIRLAG